MIKKESAKFFERQDTKLREPAKTVAAYNVLVPALATGDRSTLYQAEEMGTGRKLAMKMYSLQWTEDNPAILNNELAGIVTLGEMKIVPAIAGSCVKTSHNYYMPMELCNCGSLDLYVRIKGVFPTQIVRDVTCFVAGALKMMHAKNLAHREINPRHIVANMDDFGRVTYKLIGLAYFKDVGRNKTSSFVGRVEYNAPEVALETEYGTPVDIWSFGATLYELSVGILPSDVDPLFISKIKTGKGLAVPPTVKVDPGLFDLISKCLSYEPQKRPTAAQILEHPFTKGEAFVGEVRVSSDRLPPRMKEAELVRMIQTDFYKYMEYVIKTEGKEGILKAERRDSLDPYELIDKAAFDHGGFSEIYLCQHKVTKARVARKVIRTDTMNDTKIANLLLGEVEIMLTLHDSPFTIELLDYFVYKNQLNLIIEYCNGGDLDDYVRERRAKRKQLTAEELRLIAWNVACALRDMHDLKMMHRDIKPKNVLVVKDQDGRLIDVKLCDYGLGKKVEGQCDFQGSTILGTFDYFAPEIWVLMDQLLRGEPMEKKYDAKVDVWSYGVLLYFVAFGKSIMDPPGSKYKVTKRHEIEYPYSSEVPKGFISLIKTCLQFDSERRPLFPEILKHEFFSNVSFSPSSRDTLLPYVKGTLVGESRNGKSQVFEVRKGKELFALKMMNVAGIEPERLSAEIDTLVKLRNCKSIIRLHEYFMLKTNRTLCLVMDYYPGGNLERFVFAQEKKKLYIQAYQQLFVAYSVLSAIREMHGRNIIHRDINPQNVVVSTNESGTAIIKLALCDFGFARVLMQGEEGNTMLGGSYRSPEQILSEYGGEHTSATDIWSFGLLLYFVVFGMHFYNCVGYKGSELYKKGVMRYNEKRANISPEVIGLMNRCLTVDPEKRPSAGELLKDKMFEKFES